MVPQMTNPIAVVISDIHFNLNTLEIASRSVQSALETAQELDVPLIIAGDLNDTKAIIRAEVANRLLYLFSGLSIPIYILVGNHDKINEKGFHNGLNYLEPYAEIIFNSTKVSIKGTEIYFIPYQSNFVDFEREINMVPRDSLVVMHQGVKGASMGDYMVDNSSVNPALMSHVKCISGHYHRHQTIGTVTYLGSPYTTSFGEANDGPKGFIILNNDGSFERCILHLRKHVILETDVQSMQKDLKPVNKNDIIWIKIKGNRTELDMLKKRQVAELIDIQDFKLDKIYTDDNTFKPSSQDMTDEQMFDALIDGLEEDIEAKKYLKKLWRDIT